MAKKFGNPDLFETSLFDDPIRKAEYFLKIIQQIEKSSADGIKMQAKALKEFEKVNSLKGLRKIKTSIDEVNRETQEMIRLKKEEAKLIAKLNQAKGEQAKLNEQIRQAIKEQNKATREEVQNEKALLEIQKKEVKTLQELQTRNNALIRSRKNLDLTTKEGIADYKRLTAEINRNNTALKQHDAAIGSYNRNVGNYRDAIRGYGSQLLAIAGAGSFLTIAQNAVQINAEFEQSMADLKAITGASTEQMKFFEQQAIKSATSMEGSTASARDMIEAYKLIGSAKPELLGNAEALDEVAQKALLLADASGLELPDAATKLTDAMNQFGAVADQAGKFVDVLAAGAKYGSAEIPQITEALLEFGSVAKSSNVSIQESTAAIEALAERGIKGSEAGTKLRNVLVSLSAAKGLPREAQEAFKRTGIDVNILSDNSLSLNERLKELQKAQNDEVAMLKIFGKENIVAAKVVLNQTDRIDELTKSVDENGVAQDQASERTGTLSAEIRKLGNAWQAEMIKMGRGGGDLAKWVRFLRENLSTILTVVTKVVKGFIVYKSTIMAVRASTAIADKATALFAYTQGLLSKNTDGATKSFKALDASMKANVIGIVVTAVYQLADALGVFQSQADKLQETFDDTMATFDTFRGIQGNFLNEQAQAIAKRYQQELDLADESEKELIKMKMRGELTRAYQQESNEIDRLLLKRSMEIRKLEEEQADIRIKYEKAVSNSKKDEYGFDLANNKNLVSIKRAMIDRLKAEQSKYQEAISDMKHEEKVEHKEAADAEVADTRESTDAQIAEWKRRADEIKKIEEDLHRWLEDLRVGNISGERERAIAEEELAFQRQNEQLAEKMKALGKTTEEGQQIAAQLEIQHRTKLAEINKKFDKQELDESMKAVDLEYKMREDAAIKSIKDDERLEDKKLELKIQQAKTELDMLKGNLADKEAIVNKEIELDNLLREQYERNSKNILSDTQTRTDAMMLIYQKLAEQQQADFEKQKEMYKDIAEASKALADELTKIATERADRRIEAIDRELEAVHNRQEELRALAEQGVLEADQSLAAEERKQAELERKRIEEEKKKQRIEALNTAFKAYAGHVENGDRSPISSTIRDITTLVSFINSLGSFYDGTEDTGGPGTVDEKGGKLAILHPHERVMTAEQNKDLAGASNEEVVRVYKEAREHGSDAVRHVKMADLFADQSRWNSGDEIVRKLDSLTEVVKNKPVQIVKVDQVTSKIVSEIHEGNTIKRTHYGKFNLNA